MNTHKKGFTLIELLIVIGILAILAAAVIVVLNPAELLAQARDGQRLADVGSIESAIALYLADVNTPDLYVGGSGVVQNSMIALTDSQCPFETLTSCTTVASTDIDGTGWVEVNLGQISGGSPVSVLPTDPSNNASYTYAYAADDNALTWEINLRLESEKHRVIMDDDGGDEDNCTNFVEEDCWYESGTDLTL